MTKRLDERFARSEVATAEDVSTVRAPVRDSAQHVAGAGHEVQWGDVLQLSHCRAGTA